MDLMVNDKVFLVTGGTKGLGLATARVLREEGARVVVSSRDAAAVAQTVTALGGPEHAAGVAADNAAADTADRLVETALRDFGRLDGALISVGGPPTGQVSDITDQQWRDSFESVFLGALRIARATAAVLPEGGSIGFVLSLSVKSPWPGMGVSNGLRPGLAMAAKALADELGPRGIRVNGFVVGSIATDRLSRLEAATDDPERTRRTRTAHIPLRRYGTPEEFGRLAAVVLSPVASYTTGSMIHVEGGALRTL
ncbi:SDR family oxidoreductase [Streptantibioticus cattleyicolor]|uniref:Short-chain dehydrogenase/reductase SDR n=1 Tax=Streptantibioticus cattleyicolor (strain ATCC 35852 / DSM 46488 / JCM 4925 / NBRC 14057 / NRRL 8057) TaxID=1003195 RepID=F8JJW2_STREN|nr:SDR family oxidoreductase [Streptantibioticus cattleyicolor]AEW98611.1 short-chain dehydrogenase/reductase SDR [Streptantibioticus cattleyicolor NRRL 8057 = DSM 46488]CCB72330.1 putative oxidoreductase [Streptantibioticus cattleyicolor NRRL 8057 = DSM 46488]